MLSRRSFLFGVGTVTMAQILAGCKSENGALRVLLLENSIPPQLIGKFRSTTSQSSIFTPEPQLKTLLSLLETWQNKDSSENPQKSWLPWGNQKSSPVADLVTLGDGWLKGAIEQQLISPLDINELSQWPQLPPRWQEIVQRNQLGMVDKQGQIWGAPYRWGTTMIVYRSDILKKFDWQPTDWSDLWREELQGRISLLNQPREVIGLTLKNSVILIILKILV